MIFTVSCVSAIAAEIGFRTILIPICSILTVGNNGRSSVFTAERHITCNGALELLAVFV